MKTSKRNSGMKIKMLRAVPVAGAVLIAALAVAKLQSQELPGCLNLGGEISDHINVKCASCSQNSDGTWTTYTQNGGLACGGTEYEENVAQDIYCGYFPMQVFVFPEGVLMKNTRKTTMTGICVNGSCVGAKAPWPRTVYRMTIYDSLMCPTNSLN